ncbi:MAG: amidase [Pseudomonadota bacterium]
MTAPHPTPSGIVELDGIALSRAIHAREVSCVEVMVAYQAQIARLNPQANALVALQRTEVVMRAAQEADAALARGESAGWMHGFPQAPKDLAPVAGMVTSHGSRIHQDRVTTVDGLVVGRMRGAGSIFVGRSNSPEFGLGSHTYNRVYGLTRNAFDPSRTAGGSSGGAAVAVALRLLPVADGSDMMGSLRNPAGWNNIFGFRPSFGRVPHWPVEDVFHAQYSTSGPMARSVADIAMLLSVQAGPDPRVPFSNPESPAVFTGGLERDLRGMRIGWLGDMGGHLPMEPGVLELCEGALGHLKAIGCTVEAAQVDFPLDRLWQAWLALRGAAVSGAYRAHYDHPQERKLLKPEAVWEIENGLQLSAQDVYRASVDRTAWYQALLRVFDDFDYLVLPSAQLFPFDATLDWPQSVGGRAMDTYHRWMEVVVPATMAGLPALNVPAGFGAAGLPLGMQLIGRPKADRAVLELGHAYDLASGLARRRSPLLEAA